MVVVDTPGLARTGCCLSDTVVVIIIIDVAVIVSEQRPSFVVAVASNRVGDRRCRVVRARNSLERARSRSCADGRKAFGA